MTTRRKMLFPLQEVVRHSLRVSHSEHDHFFVFDLKGHVMGKPLEKTTANIAARASCLESSKGKWCSDDSQNRFLILVDELFAKTCLPVFVPKCAFHQFIFGC
jgi:hypothetical protein